MSFQLSSEVDKNKMFMVNRSNLEERFDCEYYSPSIVERINAIKQKPHVKLGEKLKRLQTGYNNLQNDCSGFPFIRTQNVRPIWLDLGKTSFTTDVKVRKSKVGDLLFTRIGVNVGDVGFNATGDFAISDNVILARTNNSDFAKFVSIFLSTELGAVFIEREKRDTARAIISYGNIKKILIPTLSNTTQRKVNTKMDAAYAAKKQKEAEAQALLDSIDDYLLGELGIALPAQQENTLESRIFTRPLSEVSGGRFDAFFNSLNKQDKSGKYNFYTLKTLARVKKGQSITSDDVIGGDIPVVAGGQSSPYNHNVANTEGDVITVSASGAYSGYVWHHQSPIFASDCTVISSKDKSYLSNRFLFEYLKAEQQNIYHLQQGSGQPHVYPSDLEKIKVPIPPIEKQNEIANHTSQIRQQAKQLQQDAKIGLAQAKKEVEAMILGE